MTRIQLGIAICLSTVVLCGSAVLTSSQAEATNYTWRELPPVADLLDSDRRERVWRPFLQVSERKFERNRDQWMDVISLYVSDLYKGLMAMEGDANFSQIMASFESLRGDMPIEMRWTLAAFEIKHHLLRPETLGDARSALETLTVLDGFRLVNFGLAGVPNARLYFRDIRNNSSIALPNEKAIVHLFRYWNQLRILDPQAMPQPEFETVANNWFRAIERLALKLPISTVTESISDFDNPEMRRFTSEHQREQFLRNAGQLILGTNRAVRNDWVQARPDLDAIVKMREMVGEWILSNLDYTVENIRTVESMAITTLEDIVLKRVYSREEIEKMRNLIVKKPPSFESGLLAELITANALTERTEIHEMPPSLARAIYVVASGRLDRNWVDLVRAERHTGLPISKYEEYIRLIYTLCETKVKIDGALATSFVIYPTAGQYNANWASLETRRLKLALEALGEDAFVELALPTLISGEYRTVAQRMFLSEFLNHNISAEKSHEFTKKLKAKAGLKPAMKEQQSIKTWEADQGKLVRLIYALDPNDSDLVNYLVNSVVANRVEGPVGGYSALRFLAGGNSRPEPLRQALLSRTAQIENGDIAGNFLALVRLFPEEGAALAKIIFNARVDKKLLVQLLSLLIEESESNDQLPASIERGLRLIKDPIVARAAYQNLTLDAWLRKQLQARKDKRSCEGPLHNKAEPQ